MNLCVGGAAGDGIETMAGILEKTLQRSGYELYSMRDFMSRIRGGHNFAQIRFDAEPVAAQRDALDILIAYDLLTYEEHRQSLKPDGLLLCDPELGINDRRALPIALKTLARESGNSKTIGVVCIGALMKLLGLALATAEAVLREMLPPKVLDVNLTAVQKGYDSTTQHFTPHHRQGEGSPADDRRGGHGRWRAGWRAPVFTALTRCRPPRHCSTSLPPMPKPLSWLSSRRRDEIAAINMALGASFCRRAGHWSAPAGAVFH